MRNQFSPGQPARVGAASSANSTNHQQSRKKTAILAQYDVKPEVPNLC